MGQQGLIGIYIYTIMKVGCNVLVLLATTDSAIGAREVGCFGEVVVLFYRSMLVQDHFTQEGVSIK